MIFAAAAVLAAATPAYRALDDAALMALAARGFDHAPLNGRDVIGRYHGVPVIVEYHCSDLCSDYQVRIIHFDADAGPTCRAIGGLTLTVPVPMGIAAIPRTFRVPAILGLRAVRHR